MVVQCEVVIVVGFGIFFGTYHVCGYCEWFCNF